MQDFSVLLNNKTAVVTGAGAGVARAAALALARAGASVVVNDQNPDRADSTAEEIMAAGGRAIGIQADISNRFQVSALIERARDAFGRVDIFVNGAGIYHPVPLAAIDEWDLRRQIEVNLIGLMFCTQLIGRVMADEGGGVIVNLTSTAGSPHTLPHGVAYVATKAGIVALTRQAARELAPAGIRVNAVCIGNIPENDMPAAESPRNALQRLGAPEEAASAVLFLVSDAASFITGHALTVDGGEW